MDAEKRGVREIDHSGDVGIEAWGATQRELFENATRGLFALMSRQPHESAADPRKLVERQIDVGSSEVAELLVDWLSEVILNASTHGEVYSDVSVESADDTSASGVIRGEPYDSARHVLRFDVKAATYHGLVCERTADGYYARVVFDL
jgi:SHS2 domain-containing protein